MIHSISDSALLVMVPIGAKEIKVKSGLLGGEITWINSNNRQGVEFIPPGDWQLKGLVPELWEKEAEKHVEKSYSVYKNYEAKGFRSFVCATNSLKSLCTSLGMNPELTYLLTKKQSRP